MGFSSVPNLVPWLIFRAWIVTDQFCWLIPLHLSWQGGNKRKRGVRRAIMRGRQLIEGWLLLEEIRYIVFHWNFPVFLSLFGRDFNQIKDGLGFKYIVFMNLVWHETVASQLLPLLLTINSPWGDNVGFQFNGQWSFPRKVLYNI